MAADAHHVLGGPDVRGRPGDPELPGQGAHTRPDFEDIGIDPGDEGLGVAPGTLAVGGPLGLHVAPVQEESRRPVLFHEVGPEVPRQKSQAALPPKVDLPEPVPRGVVALDKEGVARRPGIDMRDAPMVDPDLGGRRKARNLPVLDLRGGGQGLGSGEEPPEEGEGRSRQ